MTFSTSITKKLTEAFSPLSLEIIDESYLHAGHHEKFDGTGETHLRIKITADAFTGMNRIDRQRAINALIGEEIALGLHAIAMEIRSPDEI